jgi:HPt (histidine-containing phosphotransfer) domain-containing protein
MHEESDLDRNALARLKRLGGDGFLREMIHLFLQQATTTVAAALAAHDRADLRGVEQAVHSLKSSAGHIGARVIHKLAEMIEQLAEDPGERAGEIGPLLRDLQAAFQRLEPHLVELKDGLAP